VNNTKRAWLARLVLVILALGPVLALLLPPVSGSGARFVLLQLRVPRMLAGVLVGGTLGITGAATQAIFSNPLATPSTTGTLAGATLGTLFALVVSPASTIAGFSVNVLCAFCGALIASLVVAMSAFGTRRRTEDVLLVGIAVTLATSALATGIEDVADSHAIVAASRWSLGHLAQVGYERIVWLAPLLVLTWVLLLRRTRQLQNLVLGDEVAHARGVSVASARFGLLLLVSLSVAAVVAWCGPIAFVGLIVPQLIRLGLSGAQRVVLSGSLVAGAGMLVLCDALGRVIVPDRELSVGVVTALVGAPALAWLTLRRSR
jgi:ABC-type Fe3+-siderophore transport system permease subunit